MIGPGARDCRPSIPPCVATSAPSAASSWQSLFCRHQNAQVVAGLRLFAETSDTSLNCRNSIMRLSVSVVLMMQRVDVVLRDAASLSRIRVES